MKKIITIFILLFILTSCWDNIEEKNTKYYSTATVLSWSITISNSFVWYVKWDEMVDLATKVWWKVTNIYIKEWDFVEKWDTLVTLDSLEAKVWYSAADSILNSLFEMRKSTSDMFDDQIEAMNAKVEQVKEWKIWSSNWLDDTKKITSSQLSTSKAWVDTAKANLDHTKIVLETKEKHIYDNSKAAIVWAVILDTNIINFVDVLLWITEENESKNDSYEDYLSAKNIKYLREAEIKFEDVKNDYDIYKEFYDSNIDGKEPSIDDIKKWLKNWELLAEKLKSLLSVTYNVLDSSIENIYLPVDTISSYKTKISDLWVNIESSLITVSWDYVLWLKWSKQGLEDFDKAKDMELELLSKQLILAEKTYDQYLAISEWKINEVETMKNISSSQLDEILAW